MAYLCGASSPSRTCYKNCCKRRCSCWSLRRAQSQAGLSFPCSKGHVEFCRKEGQCRTRALRFTAAVKGTQTDSDDSRTHVDFGTEHAPWRFLERSRPTTVSRFMDRVRPTSRPRARAHTFAESQPIPQLPSNILPTQRGWAV